MQIRKEITIQKLITKCDNCGDETAEYYYRCALCGNDICDDCADCVESSAVCFEHKEKLAKYLSESEIIDNKYIRISQKLEEREEREKQSLKSKYLAPARSGAGGE